MGQLFKNTKINHQTFALDSSINVSGFASWTNCGITLTLPNAGLYQIFFNLSTVLSDSSTFDNKWVEGRLYNTTNSSVVSGTTTYLLTAENLGPNADYFIRTSAINCIINVSSPTVLDLQVIDHSLNSGATISNTHSSYGYIMFVGF